MRFFFHLVNGAETIPDDTGVEASDLESATACALQVICELRQDVEHDTQEWGGWHLNIVCPLGKVLATIPLGSTFH